VSPTAAPRLAPFARFGTVFGWGVRRALSGRRFFGTAGIALLAGLGLGQIASMHDDRVFALWELLDSGLVAVGVPLVALSLVGSGFAEEVQDLTLTFHLVRPVSRKTVFVARYASGLLAAVAVALLMTLSAVAASRARVPVYAQVAATATLGCFAVGALYYALAALFRRGLIAGLVYTFVVEGFFQFMPGSIQKLSLMNHVGSVFHRTADAAFAERSAEVARRLAPPNATFDFRDPTAMLTQAAEREEWTTIPGALLVCAAVVLVALGLGARAIARKDFALKD
jgi:ABC-type transport system involved in multi-copper enzyme maturation permease subunit